jgi:hypothetical protein
VRDVGSFAAIGDSFTEGYGDFYPNGSCRGWADRFAWLLAASAPGLTYANLAVRGKLLRQVVTEQVSPAVAMKPDLISLAAAAMICCGPGPIPMPWRPVSSRR